MSDGEGVNPRFVTLEDAGTTYRICLPDAETDYIQAAIASARQPYEIQMLRDMASTLGRDDLVLDVGANIGNHSLYLAAVAGCRVVAFEPNSHLVQAIRTSAEANGLGDRLTVVNSGVGAAAGRAHFLSEITTNLGAQSLVPGDGEIEVVALDDLAFGQDVTVIKVDVEGMELAVLKGAAALLARDTPSLYVECMSEGDFRAVLRYLEPLGYLHWDTFNPTATHLFMHASRLNPQQQVHHYSVRQAINGYRSEIMLRETREKLTSANDKYRQVGQDLAVLKESYRHQVDLLRRSEEARLLAQNEADELRQSGVVAQARLQQALDLIDTLVRGRDGAPPLAGTQLTAAHSEAPQDETGPSAHATTRSVARTLATDKSVDPLKHLEVMGYVMPRRLSAAGQDDADTLKLADRTALRIACIMDDFTVACFGPEADLRHLTPDNWADNGNGNGPDNESGDLEGFSPDCLFVESVWRGKDDLWGNKVARKDQAVCDIVAWFKARQIPTLFWNKEDPVHFQTFISTAQLFDHVFTTDIDCVNRYKQALGHNRVYFLPFACQPRVHNPLEIFERKKAISFAGAYYVRYPERTETLEGLMSVLPAILPVDIFDRNFGKTDVNYMFPPQYDPFIVGTLPSEHIDIAYKGYTCSINLNSVKQSQSMFARRVYELLASNTTTLSNYSRGLRLMFGDLVISSDSVDEVTRRFADIVADPLRGDRLRLAGLRKVMSEHTVEDRLDYIAGKLFPDRRPADNRPRITVFSAPSSSAAASSVLDAYARQTCAHVSFIIVLPRGHKGPVPAGIKVMTKAAAAARSVADIAADGWFAFFHEDDYYGPNYLTDLSLATRYSSPDLIGKSRCFRCDPDQPGRGDSPHLDGPQLPYTPVRSLAVRASMVRAACTAGQSLGQSLGQLSGKTGLDAWHDLNGLAIDPFNYCRDGRGRASVPAMVDDLPEIRTGLALSIMQGGAEAIPTTTSQRSEHILTPETLLSYFSSHKTAGFSITAADGGIEVSSTLAHDKHEYLNSTVRLAPDTLIRDGVFKCFFDCTPSLSVRFALFFYDKDKKRIGSAMASPGRNETLDVPAETHEIRASLRVAGSGQAQIKGLVIGHRDIRLPHLFSQSRVLVLTNKYPSYHSLYRNAFVHSRVRSYEQSKVAVDVFRLDDGEAKSAMEFENVDVMTGDGDTLDQFLRDGRHDTVLVHFLRPDMWSVLLPHIDRIRVVVWLHGAEIQPWWRRKFNYTTDQQLDRARELTTASLAFWREILAAGHRNLKLVFVSRYFADEVMEDLGLQLDPQSYDVIHNPIDTDIFVYRPKAADDRLKIVSIRPYVSRVYANDLSVEAVLLLAQKPFFDKLQFQFCGDGALFDETLAPLRQFPNVRIQRGYLTHDEIAHLHADNGVFLVPSRGDTQGVSRDEAMASGLVPVTNLVGAIPEFVDETCAMLAPEEDAAALAAGIEKLYHDPDLFLRMSAAAAQRVRRQSGKDIIIGQEMALFAQP